MRKTQKTQPVDQGSKEEAGFSLIEILIAVVVLVFGLVSIVGITAYVSRANSTSNTINIYAAAAQDQVDRLRTAVWTAATEDPMLAVGGSIPTTPTGPSSPSSPSLAAPLAATQAYTYTLDPDNPHLATVSNTPIGSLRVSWQVSQGPTPDVRYVTIKVDETVVTASRLPDGFRVTTIITRN